MDPQLELTLIFFVFLMIAMAVAAIISSATSSSGTVVTPTPSPTVTTIPSVTVTTIPSVTVGPVGPDVVLDNFEASNTGTLVGQMSLIPPQVWAAMSPYPSPLEIVISGPARYASSPDNTTRGCQVALAQFAPASDNLNIDIKAYFQSSQTSSASLYFTFFDSATGDGRLWELGYDATSGSLTVNIYTTVAGVLQLPAYVGTSNPGPDPTDHPTWDSEITVTGTFGADGTTSLSFTSATNSVYNFSSNFPGPIVTDSFGLILKNNTGSATQLPMVQSVSVTRV